MVSAKSMHDCSECHHPLHAILIDAIDEINEVFSMDVRKNYSSNFFSLRADTINQVAFCFLPLQMVPVFLNALLTKMFIAYLAIQSFTDDLKIDWFTIFATSFWILYLVVPSMVAIYAGAITSDEVGAKSSFFMFTQFSINYQ